MFIYEIANKMPCHIITISHLGAFNKSTHYAFKILCVSRQRGRRSDGRDALQFQEMINHKARGDFSRGRPRVLFSQKTKLSSTKF